MAIIAADTGGGDYKIVPANNHIGVCSMVIDLGKQLVEYQGESKLKHQVYIAWELPNEPIEWTDKDGNERKGFMRIGKTYTVSLHENSNLRSDLENWRGRRFSEDEAKGFDITNLAGVPAMVNVTHAEKNGRTYANVTGVTPLPKGMEKPTPSDLPIIYDDEHLEAYGLLPEWLQKKIDAQVKDQPKREMAFAGDLDDDVPF